MSTRTATPAARPARRARRRPPERALVAIGLGVLVLALGWVSWLWLRDSSFVRVEQVRVTGLESSQAGAVRRALESAARDMTTLNVREDVLRTAVSPYASVAGLEAESDFPHGLEIHVTERKPVAQVRLGAETVPVGAEGRLLRGVEARGHLPAIDGGDPGSALRLTDRRALAAISVLAAAPGELGDRVRRVKRGDRGMALELREGPDLIFGSATRVRAKWMAAARVLAEPSAVGAVYLDLRVPERVAAGGVAPAPEPTPAPSPSAPETVAPAAETATTPAAPTAPDAAVGTAVVQP